MKPKERKKMSKDVFAPKSGEKILFLIDTPHQNIIDSNTRKERRKMAQEWSNTFKQTDEENDFSDYFSHKYSEIIADINKYPASANLEALDYDNGGDMDFIASIPSNVYSYRNKKAGSI